MELSRCVQGSSRIRNGRPTRMRDEPPYFIDIINHSLSPCKLNPAQIIQLHTQKGLSAEQIAQKLGLSRTTVVRKLRTFNLYKSTPKGQMNNPKNYRAFVAPYGFRKEGYQLVPYPKEIKICRLVVQLINNKKLSLSATARKLEEKGFVNRRGRISWSAKTVKAIYERWAKKL